MAGARRKEFDIILVHKLDRFARDEWTAPKLLFEKKELIPDLQELLKKYEKVVDR